MEIENSENYIKVRKILSGMLTLKEEDIKPESNLRTQLGIDSVDVMDIIVRMEKEFNLEAPDDFNPQIETVEDIVGLVGSLKQKSH